MPAWTLAVYSCKPRVYTLLMYKCVSILNVCQTAVCGREGPSPLWTSSTFFTVQVFNNFLHISTGPRRRAHPTHITVYIFYKFGPSLVSISQSVLSHLAFALVISPHHHHHHQHLICSSLNISPFLFDFVVVVFVRIFYIFPTFRLMG